VKPISFICRRLKSLNRTLLLGLTGLYLAGSSNSFAAIQGEEGLTSTGQIVVRLAFQPSYQISRVDDIILQVSDFDQSVKHKERLCIRGPKNSSYTITAASETTNRFALENGAGGTIPYKVTFYDSLSKNTPDRLYPEEQSRSYAITDTNRDCDGQDNTAVEISIEAEDLKNAEAGIYDGVLLLTVGSV